MANNIFVSYDLNNPGQNYETVIAEIKKHGTWVKVEYSLFFLSTDESPKSIAEAVWRVMDQNDRLIVIDAKNNQGYWYLPDSVNDALQRLWT